MDQVQLAVRRAAETVGGQAKLAELLRLQGPSPRAVVWAWCDRGRVPVEHCAAIESATAGAVRRWHLRPSDWHLIWPELICDPDAPAVQADGSAS